jgi:hypothetical protein
MCVPEVGPKIARGEVGASIMQMGQSSNSMALEGQGSPPMNPRLPHQVKVFILGRMVSCFVHNTVHFSPLGLKINHMLIYY